MSTIENETSDKPEKILIIDDESVTRMMLVKILRKFGYDVFEAANGEDGIEGLITFKPDLVLLDVVMPGMDGFEVCKEIRKVTPYNETPVLMLTGLNDESSVDQAFTIGANDFVTKPINWSLLAKRVKYLLRDRIINMKILENEARLLLAQSIAKISYWELNPNNKTIQISDTFTDHTGLPSESLYDLEHFLEIIHEDDRVIVRSKINNILEDGENYKVDHRVICGQEKECIMQQHGEAIWDENGDILKIIGTLQNITEQRHAEHLIEYQRNYDDLTELPNKNYFYNEFDSYMEDRSEEHMLAVAFVGIDRFKNINESMGYKSGDFVLKETGSRIKKIILGRGFVARYNNDTFAIIIDRVRILEEIECILNDIQDSLSSSYSINNEDVYLTSSIGITIYPLDEGSPEELSANAEFAMGQAKEEGGSRYCYYSPDMNENAVRKRELEKHVRYALDNDGFELHYQPQIDLHNNKVIGAEALLRMQTKDGTWVSPVDFIPIAEDTGLIVPLGYWIIESACKQICEWIDDGLTGLRYGINLSARQFTDKDLEKNLNESVQRYNLPAEVVDLEITESIAMDDMTETLNILHKFKKNGYTISMDDFGTGHSSLSYLKELPIDILKVDRAFIKDINAKGENGEIAKTVIDMAHNLNMQVIAEGAEDIEHINFLVEHGCDEVQGFYYSKPLTVDEYSNYVKNFESDEIKILAAH